MGWGTTDTRDPPPRPEGEGIENLRRKSTWLRGNTKRYREGGKGTARSGHGVWARTASTVEEIKSFFSPP